MNRLQLAAPIEVIPEADQALAELGELASYLPRVPELSVGVCRLFDEGMPGFDCEVDWSAAKTTGRALAHYKLPERLRALLLALRARDRDLHNVNERSRVRGFGDGA
jgi:hypothetical protein